MNNNIIESSFLFDEDFDEIVETLSGEKNAERCIEPLIKLYGKDNPDFLNMLCSKASNMADTEIGIVYKKKMLNESQYPTLLGIYFNELRVIDEFTELEIEQALNEIAFVRLRHSKNFSERLLNYTRVHLELLLFEKKYASVECDKTESLEDTFKRLDTIEKLYLLQLLVDNDGLNVIYSAKDYLITILSLITGIKETTIEGNLKKYNNWYKINANLRKSNGELLARKKSIEKILSKINTVKNDPIVKEIVKTLEFQRDRFDVESNKKKSALEKKG